MEIPRLTLLEPGHPTTRRSGRAAVHAISLIIGITFLVTSATVLVGSRGKHLAWPLFLIIAIVALYAAGTYQSLERAVMRARVLGARSTSSLAGSSWRRTRFKNRWTRCSIHYALKGPRAPDGLSGAPGSQ